MQMQSNEDGFLYKSCPGIFDDNIEHILSSVDPRLSLKFFREPEKTCDFIKLYENWLFSHKDYQTDNLDKHQFQPFIMIGTLQSFHDFYQIHHTKVLKIRRGEFPYHKQFFNSVGRKWGFIDDEGITENDFAVLSYPFFGDGSVNERELQNTLQLCQKHSVPVLLDCAFWGLSSPLFLPLREYSCIKMLSFSLSKFFNVGRLRIGMMYSQYKTNASGAILDVYRYVNSYSVYIAIQLLRHFSISYMNQKYREIQKGICKKQGIIPSDTLLFGVGGSKQQTGSLLDDKFYRICLSSSIAKEYKRSIRRSVS